MKTNNKVNKIAIKEQKCKCCMTAYMELDKGERVPLSLSRHLFFCPSCHTKIRLMRKAEVLARNKLSTKVPYSDESIESVMQSIAPVRYKKQKNVVFHLRYWVSALVIMVALCLAPSIFTEKIQTRIPFFSFSLAYASIMTFCVVGYCFAFALGNIDFFIKRIAKNN